MFNTHVLKNHNACLEVGKKNERKERRLALHISPHKQIEVLYLKTSITSRNLYEDARCSHHANGNVFLHGK